MTAPATVHPGPTGTPEVLVTWPDYDVDGPSDGAALRAAGLGVRLAPKRGGRTAAQMRALIGDAAAAIVSTDPFDAEVIAASPSLRVIARVGVGVDSIDLAAATAAGVAVTVTPGANETTVADHTVALMLAAQRRLCEHDRAVRRGEWNRTGAHAPWLLSGTTVGLVGYGRIGQLVRDRLAGFDVRVVVSDPDWTDAEPAAMTLNELLEVSDVVSLHTPLLPATRGLIGAEALARMRPGAILVNTARGGVVDEDALLEALQNGRLRGAALDVFAEEPPARSPLLALPNVIVSPHNAGISRQSVAAMTARATKSVIAVLDGDAPSDLANPELLGDPAGPKGATRGG